MSYDVGTHWDAVWFGLKVCLLVWYVSGLMVWWWLEMMS